MITVQLERETARKTVLSPSRNDTPRARKARSTLAQRPKKEAENANHYRIPAAAAFDRVELYATLTLNQDEWATIKQALILERSACWELVAARDPDADVSALKFRIEVISSIVNKMAKTAHFGVLL